MVLLIGNDELGGPIERRIKCPSCGEFHQVEDSESSRVWDNESKDWKPGPGGILQFYRCGRKTFLAGINGLAIPD